MGVIINGAIIVICGILGLRLAGGIPDQIHQRVMQGIALCVLAIGIDGALGGQETIVLILSMVFGAMIGEWIDIDAWIKGGIQKLEQKYARGNGQQDLGPGFVAGVMIFCIGSMSILGSLEAGLTGSNTTLYTKSILDGITAILLGSSFGAGVILSAIPVILMEGAIVLLAGVLAPVLSDAVVHEIIAVGSLLLVGLAFNMLNLSDLKIMNYTPAMLLPPFFMALIHLFF